MDKGANMENNSVAQIPIDKTLLSQFNDQLNERNQSLPVAVTCAVKLWLELPENSQQALLAGQSIHENISDIMKELILQIEKHYSF